MRIKLYRVKHHPLTSHFSMRGCFFKFCLSVHEKLALGRQFCQSVVFLDLREVRAFILSRNIFGVRID